MKDMLAEFKAFINKGNVLTVAVALIMALYFQEIVNALLEGVIKPLIAAIFGKPSLGDVGFDIGDSRISIGLVIGAIIDFLVGPPDNSFVEYNVFKYAKRPAGGIIAQQYALRAYGESIVIGS